MGYKLEVPPIFPGIGAGVLNVFGKDLQQEMAALPHANAVLALLRDGFVEQCPGGRVRLADHGNPMLDYVLSDYVWDGARRAYLSMVELQFAAGAKRVRAAHLDSNYQDSWPAARRELAELPLKKFRATLFTAHQMGGCAVRQNP